MGKERDISNKMIVSIAGCAFILLIIFWLVSGIIQQYSVQYGYRLDSHWSVSKNGTLLYSDSNIESCFFGNIEIGDVVDLDVKIPSQLDGGYSVEILTYLCAVEASIDGQQIYSYALDRVGKDVMIGSGYHFIDLPEEVSGKDLHIKLIMNEPNAFTSLAVPRCVKTSERYVKFAQALMINTLIGMFLFGLGTLLTGVSVIASFFDVVFRRLIYIGLFSILMGSWILQSGKAYQIYTIELLSGTALEYISLYFAPLPFALLIGNMREEDKSWRGAVVKAVIVVMGAFPLIASVLHFANVFRYPRVLIIFHGITLICIVAIAVAGYITVEEKTRAETITAIGIIVLIFVLGLDIARFNIQKFILPNYNILLNSFVPLAILMFVLLLLISYLVYLYDMAMTRTEKDTLTKLAYHDVLTGLYNRAKYEVVLGELDESSAEFALVSIDLNDLKYVNDTYGHDKGDLMLTTFAYILITAFDGMGSCFRIGGDEYVVIVDDKHCGMISQALVRMNIEEQEQSANQIFNIHASYGIAYRSEIDDGQAFKVFRLADRRMYEMKSKSKGKEYVFGNSSKNEG